MAMERSISSLTYKGSVSNAIVEAQRQKKLFLVYISGEDENSTRLEQSTWVDQSVAETISRYCIFLHLIQGSVDALQFSAIYPQKSVPSITAVGYNGVMLWQHEGYISAENFVASIEKAWAALHFQETAVTLLTAALASKKFEPLNSSLPDVQENSSASDIASTSAGEPAQNSEDRPLGDSKLPVEQPVSEPIDSKDTRPGVETSSRLDHVKDVKIAREEQASSTSNISKEVLHSVTRDMHDSSTCNDSDVSTAPKENITSDESHSEASPVSAWRMTVCGPGSSQITATTVEEKTKTEEVSGPTDCSNAIKSDSNGIHLNIRLPNGASLQKKFAITDNLRSVKNYVDENQISGIGSYDLAVPYPRKVFNEEDMNSVLSELGFAGRQALIVVPHRQASGPQRGHSSSNDSQNAASVIDSSDDNGGYFGFVKRVLSYMNPFSYLGGNTSSSNSEPTPTDSFRQYRPNPALQSRYLSGGEASRQPYSLNHQNPSGGDNVGETRRRPSRPFGSNIHTLRHDEDDFPSGDRNTFWNGNSTEFGGDDKK